MFGEGLDAQTRRTMEMEMEQVRKNTGLPKLAKAAQAANEKSNITKMVER